MEVPGSDLVQWQTIQIGAFPSFQSPQEHPDIAT
jgi:hypothetical protein